MRITIRLLGKLRRHLPIGGGFDSMTLEVEAGTSIAAILQRIDLPGDETYLLMLNGERVPPPDLTSRTLQDGDELTVSPPIKGG